MIREKKILKENGLKPEDCAVIAQAAGKFKSGVFIIKASKKVNAKSIMGLLSLNMKKGDSIYLSVTGEDEKLALETLYALL